MLRRRPRRDTRWQAAKEWMPVIVLGLLLTLVPLSIWARIAAPCQYVDWLPATEVPARCLTGDDR